MARHLATAGYGLTVCLNRSPLPEGLAATVAPGPAEVARVSDVVLTVLPDTTDVERVLLGEAGVATGIAPGALVIDMSSISPIATAGMAAAIRAKGAGYLDAPVSGGEVGARAVSLTIMAGGPQAEFDRAPPLFDLLGKNIILVGEANGAGQTCKIVNQIIVALNIEAVAEALVFASKAGCDPAGVRQALLGGFASSRVLEVHEVHGQRMIDRAFDPGFRIRLHQKDLGLALETARSLGVALPNTTTAQELLDACAARGGADQDHAAMVRALEILADHPVA